MAAAAWTSTARPAAPMRRMGSQCVGVAVLPPAICRLYRSVSRSACSTVTSFQATSSSSAISMGNAVLMPWPTSGFCATMVTEPSGRMRMNALGTNSAGNASPSANPAKPK